MSERKDSPNTSGPYDQPLDDDKLFSAKRFRRGFKSGFRQALQASALGIPLFSALAVATAPPEVKQQMADFITQLNTEQVALGLVFAGAADATVATSYGIASGTIDSFRPTSKRFEEHLRSDYFKDINNDYHALRDFNYKETGMAVYEETKKVITGAAEITYAILRPKLSQNILDHKRSLINTATTSGAAAGGLLWAGSWMTDKFNRLDEYLGMTPTHNQIIDTVYQYPVETIIAGGLVGLAGSTYALIAGRRPKPANEIPT